MTKPNLPCHFSSLPRNIPSILKNTSEINKNTVINMSLKRKRRQKCDLSLVP